MKTFTIEDIRSWNPCYDPNRHLPEDWKGTVIDILKNDDIPFQDRLWLILRTELVSDKVMRLFAVWSYRQTLSFIANPDPRSIEAANIAEKFALGQATEEELSAARLEAESAAYSARSAAYSARSAWSAEQSAWSAWSATQSAAQSAAASAAWSAAQSAWSAWSATQSAWSAWSATQSAAQRDKLIEMIEEWNKTI